MTRTNKFFKRHYLFSTLLFAGAYGLASPAGLYARTLTLANFDDVEGTSFFYKDEKGTELKSYTEMADPEHRKILKIDLNIIKGGYAGWGLSVSDVQVSDYTKLKFYVRGEAGGEKFQIALKDTAGVETKLPLSRFTDVATSWRLVRIPLKEFENVKLNSIDNLNFIFTDLGRSKIFIDDIELEGPDQPQTESLAPGTSTGKMILDGFERPNPTDHYLIYEGDESSLKLNASRIAFEGDYAMELEYILATSRSWGSWVTAQWNVREAVLNWKGIQEVKLRVKGDGSGNIFRFVIKDSDGEKWFFEDKEVLKSTRWELLSMSVEQFVLEKESSSQNRKLDLDQVRSYAFTILGTGGSSSTSGNKSSTGRVTLDYLYLLGDQISAVASLPPKAAETAKIRLLKVGNIEMNGQVLTEFLNAPEQASTVFASGKLIFNGKIKKYSAKIELAAQSQEYGEAARYAIDESSKSGVTTVNQFPKTEAVNVQAIANDLSLYLTQVTVGSQFVDYSPFTFAPSFGYKGMSLEGDIDFLNYHAFILKHRYNSFTAGSRLKTLWQGFRATGITVYYKETAKIFNAASQSANTLAINPNLVLEEVQNDWVYVTDIERYFFDKRILWGGTIGYNRYTKRAEVDRTDPFNPVFGNLINPPLAVEGRMGRSRLELAHFGLPGLRLNYEYRSIDTEFKPRYRQTPINFDDLESDQRGHNFRALERWRGFQTSFEFDTMERASNDIYTKRKLAWGMGYYGFDNIDISFNQELRRETYKFTSNRTGVTYDQNQKILVSEIYIRAQLTPQVTLFFRPKREDIVHPSTGKVFTDESLYSKIEFFPATNLKILGEFKTAHFGIKDNEPKGQPFDDNFLRIKIEFNF